MTDTSTTGEHPLHEAGTVTVKLGSEISWCPSGSPDAVVAGGIGCRPSSVDNAGGIVVVTALEGIAGMGTSVGAPGVGREPVTEGTGPDADGAGAEGIKPEEGGGAEGINPGGAEEGAGCEGMMPGGRV